MINAVIYLEVYPRYDKKIKKNFINYILINKKCS